MRSDYQLKHQLFGSQGSLWERQTTPETQRQIRQIVRIGGSSEILNQIDEIAGGVVNTGQTLVNQASFTFSDGEFAVVGRRQRDYAHVVTVDGGGYTFYAAYRPTSTTIETIAIPTLIARLVLDFVSNLTLDSDLLDGGDDRDWYILPIPEELNPIMLQGKNADEFLVAGVDFLSFNGYIAMTNNPGDVLAVGSVNVPAAYKRATAAHSYVTATSSIRRGNKFVAEYARKSQSLRAFKAAAAEHAGLYVFQSSDVVLSAAQVGLARWVYTTAVAGVIEIDYPHQTLQISQVVSPGFVICGRYEMTALSYNSSDDYNMRASAGWDTPLSLDGILPVKGLSWYAGAPVLIDAVETDPGSGYPHLRIHFDGDDAARERFWNISKAHELRTGNFLSAALIARESPNPVTIPGYFDFWRILSDYYGPRLIVVTASAHSVRIDARLRSFLLAHHPISCVVLLGIATTLPEAGAAVDSEGNPLVFDASNYVEAGHPFDKSEILP